MILNKTIEALPKSAVKATVTVDGATTRAGYDKLIREYTAKAQIKGFRPGKVPASVLETKFGDGIREEASHTIIDEAFQELATTLDDKPLPYAHPGVNEEGLKFVPGEEFTFELTFDIWPKIKLETYKGLTVEEPQVTVDKEDLERELAQIQDQNAMVIEVQDAVKKGDMVTVSFAEIDEKEDVVAGTAQENINLTLGSDHNLYHFDEELVGLKKDTPTVISKTYPAEFEHSELAGKSIRLRVTISKIRRKDLPALDDELAQDVDAKFKTLDDLKKDIKTRLETAAADRAHKKTIDNLLSAILEKHSFDLPESMIFAQLYQQWDRMVQQLGGNEETLLRLLSAQGKSVDNLFEDWKPGVEKTLREQVLVQELLKAEKLEVSEEEVEAELKSVAEKSNMQLDDAKKYYKDNKMEDYLRQDLLERKLFTNLLAASTIKKGAKVKLVDLK